MCCAKAGISSYRGGWLFEQLNMTVEGSCLDLMKQEPCMGDCPIIPKVVLYNKAGKVNVRGTMYEDPNWICN